MDNKKTIRLLKRVFLKRSDLQSIQEAVQQAEKKTNGEIALALIKESHDYTAQELLWAGGFGLLGFFILIPFAQQIFNLLSTWVWYPTLPLLLLLYAFVIIVIGILAFFLVNNASIERLIIPAPVKHAKVHARALQHFVESGVYRTEAGTGILIFLSSQERRVVIVADEGINKKIEQQKWDEICAGITTGIKNNHTKEALINAIDECGQLLAKNFPKTRGNPNELSDGLVLLDH